MKTKRFLAWLLVLAMCFALTACGGTGAPAPDGAETTTSTGVTTTQPEASTPEKAEATAPLLYKVTDGSGHVAWLFGSIHVGREEFYPLPAYVLDAFDGADSLAVEADIIAFEADLSLQMQALQPMVYTDGTSIKDHISEEMYTKAVAVLKELGSYTAFMDLYCPALWSNMIDSLQYEKLGANISLGVDRHLLERANETQKEILEVESVAFQYQMMAGFSAELQAVLLESSLETYDDPDTANADLTAMMDLWASGDEQAFAAYLAADTPDLTAEETVLYEEYTKAMLVDRNLSMADYAETALQSGKEVFICVGAAHIVGESAVAQLLTQRGYTVECVSA